MREIGEEVACGQLDILSRSGVPGTLTRVSKGLDIYIHMNVSANIHTHKNAHTSTRKCTFCALNQQCSASTGPQLRRKHHSTVHSGLHTYRVIFLTGPPLKISLDWPPPNLLGLAPPPKFPKCLNHIHFARHLDVFQS